MKSYSSLALAAALAAGLGTLAAGQPALAAKKEQPAKSGLNLSQAFVKVAKPAQDAVNAKDAATAEPLVVQAEAAATNDDEKYVAAQLRLAVTSLKINAQTGTARDETQLAGPLDTLIANPSTPAADKARYLFLRGQLSFTGRQPAQAIQYLTQARAAGYKDSNLDLMIAQAKMGSGDLAGGSADLDTAIAAEKAAGKPAPEDWYKYAIARSLKAQDKARTLSWISKWITAYPTAQNWHDALITYGLSTPSVDTLDKNQRIDLFRLMYDTKSLGDQSMYEQYAQDVLDRGLPTEALTVLKDGQAAGKLTGGRNINEAITDATAKSKAEGSLTPLEAKAKTSADGKLASQTADAYLSKGDNAKAIELYRLALSKGGVATDEVNTHLGIALARSGDKAGATAAFAQVKPGVRGNMAQLWTTWLATKA